MASTVHVIEENKETENRFLSWLRSAGLAAYAERFTRSGYDDLDLLKLLNEEEEKSMFESLAIPMPEHVVKLRKCLQLLRLSTSSSGSAVMENRPPKDNQREPRQASEYETKVVSLFLLLLFA